MGEVTSKCVSNKFLCHYHARSIYIRKHCYIKTKGQNITTMTHRGSYDQKDDSYEQVTARKRNQDYEKKKGEAVKLFRNCIQLIEHAKNANLTVERLGARSAELRKEYGSEKEMKESSEYEELILLGRKHVELFERFTAQAADEFEAYEVTKREAELLKQMCTLSL